MNTGDKLLSVLVESLSVEDLEKLLAKKKKAGKPKKMTEDEYWENYYKERIIKLGILYPPKNR